MATQTIPAWHECYKAALLELDGSKIPSKIRVARTAVVAHLKTIKDEGKRQERDRAIQALRMLELLQFVSNDGMKMNGTSKR